MDKDYLLKTTTNLYRLTLLFPKKESLRFKTRELAGDIMAKGTELLIGLDQPQNIFSDLKGDLEIMDSYLELAKNQDWVSPFDVLEIQQEYANIMKQVKLMEESNIPLAEKSIKLDFPQEQPEKSENRNIFDGEAGSKETRQQKILELLRSRESVQVGELMQVFPNVSKRTLRRDFECLLAKGIVNRLGEKSSTFYKLRA
jgi:hypothetical protein